MNTIMHRRDNTSAWKPFVAILVLGCAMAAPVCAEAQSLTPPNTLPIITPPMENAFSSWASRRNSRLQWPAHHFRRLDGFLDGQELPRGSHPFQRFFGRDFQIATHFLSHDANPNDAAPDPFALRERDVAELS